MALLVALSILSAEVDIGRDNSFKAYMDYRTLTAVGTEQVRLQKSAWTDTDGYRRFGANRYMIALGTYYADRAGELCTVVFEDGTSIKCIVGDIKADEHTDATNRYRKVNEAKGCIVEFIVDADAICHETKMLGDCSVKFPGKVAAIVK